MCSTASPTWEKLNLSENALGTLPEDVFDGLSNLEKLNLSENALGTLPEDVFDGLSSLEDLGLKQQWPERTAR